MLFHTPAFLIFAAVLLAALSVASRGAPRKVTLLVASYVFYMWWNPAFILLIVASTAIDYHVGQRLRIESAQSRRRGWLLISLAANLGLLAWFKYAGFLEQNLMGVARLFGYEPSWPALQITLPVGISFYTFQTMSYTIDVYRGRLKPARSPLDFALYVAFFPQLVAGPIVRASDFLYQLERPSDLHVTPEALLLITRGMSKKVLVADNLAPFVDAVFAQADRWPSAIVWAAALCFAVQIYCDFSGYSDMAIGIARILGFELPLNFRRPYFARNPSDFWQRWHISLSSWLRDYLYIPLGGNRYGTLRTQRNLMLTMLLGGLWHGASWNFVLWGFLHGVALIAHRAFSHYRIRRGRAHAEQPPSALAHLWAVLLMQYWVLLTWIPFRAADTDTMLILVRKFVLFDFNLSLKNLGLGSLSVFTVGTIYLAFWILHALSHRRGDLDVRFAKRGPALLGACAATAGYTFFMLWPLKQAPFIYFQF